MLDRRRKRSSQSSRVGPRKASIKNTLAASGIINNNAADPADDAQPLGRTLNPLFNEGGGGEGENRAESKEETVCIAHVAWTSSRLVYNRPRTAMCVRACSLLSVGHASCLRIGLATTAVHVHAASPGTINVG